MAINSKTRQRQKRLKDIRDPEGRRIGYVTMDGKASDFSGRYVGDLRDDMRIYSSSGTALDIQLTNPTFRRGTIAIAILLLAVAGTIITILESPVACACQGTRPTQNKLLPTPRDVPPVIR